MYGRCVALLVVMAFAITAHAEDVTPNQMARTVEELDAVEFLQENAEPKPKQKSEKKGDGNSNHPRTLDAWQGKTVPRLEG